MGLTDHKITDAKMLNKGNVGKARVPGLSYQEQQSIMDELVRDVVKTEHNALIDDLESTESNSGADAIGFDAATSGLAAANVGAALRELKGDVDEKAPLANVLTLDNTTEFTPDGNYEPATKKYVDDTVVRIGAGDMAKAVYDTNDDGTVDSADDSVRLGGELPEYYQAQHTTQAVTLSIADWTDSTQTVSVAGVTATNTVFVAPSSDSQAAYTESGVKCTAQGAGTLTFGCDDTPGTAITANVAILEVTS